MDELFGLPAGLITGGIGSSLLALTVWLILTGRLVPRRVLLDVQAERDAWRKVAEEATRQNTQLLVAARVTTDLIRELPTPRDGVQS